MNKTKRKTAARKSTVGKNDGSESSNKDHLLQHISVDRCLMLERNPQYLTPKQMTSLKISIERDGFVAPILVRPLRDDKFEVVSGNHRFMAAQELGYKTVPAVVAKLADKDAKRLAINLNLIHGDPLAEQLAPFLADLDDDVLGQIHLEGELREEVLRFDDILGERLRSLEDVPGFDQDSTKNSLEVCICQRCGRRHFALKSGEQLEKTTREQSGS